MASEVQIKQFVPRLFVLRLDNCVVRISPRFIAQPCTPREVGRLYGNYFVSRKLWEVNKSSLKLVDDFHRNEKRDHPKPAGRMVENRMGDSERIAEKYPAIE